MSDSRNFFEALTILLGYDEKGDYMAAEHDEIWIGGPQPKDMTEQDVQRLRELHVRWDEYTESWHTYT